MYLCSEKKGLISVSIHRFKVRRYGLPFIVDIAGFENQESICDGKGATTRPRRKEQRIKEI
jgi:hypothetical protein